MNRLRLFLRAYLEGRWLSVGLALLGLVAYVGMLLVAGSSWLAGTAFYLYLLGLLGLLVTAVHHGSVRRWKRGLWKAFCLIALSPLNPLVAILMLLGSLAGDRGDDFGKDIVIPPDLVMEIPTARATNVWAAPIQDDEGTTLRQSGGVGPEGAWVEADTAWLLRVEGASLDRLTRHLAASARWRMTQEDGKRVAIRRAAPGGAWSFAMNGFYTDFSFDRSADRFQYRLVLGLDGPAFTGPWARQNKLTKEAAGQPKFSVEPKPAKAGEGTHYESYLVVTGPVAAVEFFEQSGQPNRGMTREALRQLAAEMTAVLDSEWDPARLAEGSRRIGEPALLLANSFQGGLYDVYGFINPGEPGYLYLKAFEVTRGTALSARRLKDDSLEYVGWSDDPGEQYFWNAHIMIGEGDWGTYYPARFEVWFVPASGAPERKLLEKVFRIEGWMR